MIDIVRSRQAPESLSSMKSYKDPDVLEALSNDFLGKCYLCETPVDVGTFEVDHRKPQGEFHELKYEWSNLFPTCNQYRCNGRRKKSYPEGGLLDPGGEERIEQRVSQRLERPSGVLASATSRFVFAATHTTDIAAINTAAELDRIHNATGSHAAAPLTARALRKAILDRVVLVARKIAALEQMSPDDAHREVLIQELRDDFSRAAPYTMLVRSCFDRLPSARELFD